MKSIIKPNLRALINFGVLFSFFSLLLTATGQAEQNVSYGWSTNADENTAVEEAVSMIKKDVNDPDFVILYSTVDYNVPNVIKEINAKLNNPKLFGITSCQGVITTDGVHFGENGAGSLAMLGFHSGDMNVGVATSEITDMSKTKAIANTIIKDAVENAGKSIKDKPSLILIGSTPGFEEKVIEEIQNVFGNEVPVYGGSAADNDLSGKWLTFANSEVNSSGVSLALIYSKSPVSGHFAAGYLGGKQAGKVTSMNGRTINTIDDKPAATVYNEWSKGLFTDDMKNGELILGKSAFNPLAKAIKTKDSIRYITLHPARITPENQALEVFAEPFADEPIYYTEGNADILINRVTNITKTSLVKGRIKKKNISGGLHIYCAGSMLAVKNRVGEIVPKINNVMGEKPFIGAFTFGEQGLFEGYGNFHGNLMSSMVVFAQ